MRKVPKTLTTIMTSMIVLLGVIFTLQASAKTKKYIVTVKSAQTYKMLSAQAKGFHTFDTFAPANKSAFSFLNSDGAQISQAFDHLEMVVIETENSQDIEMLKASGMVDVEEEMILPEPTPIGTFSDFAPTNSNDLYGPTELPWGIKAVKAPEAWPTSHQGEGVRVLILDTGIDRDHPALRSKFEEGKNFMNRSDNPPYEYLDVNGHGTHVAGTIAGDIVGVAPKASILSGRVCSGGCSTVAIIAGVDWGIEKQVDVMNLSLGGPFPSAAAQKAYERAEAANIVVVAASGNDGTGRVSYPAAFPTTFAVGAVDNKLVKAGFSQWGPELDIVAPGVDTISSVPMGSGRSSTVLLHEGTQPLQLESAPMNGSGFGSISATDIQYVGLAKEDDFKSKPDLTGKIALIKRGEISFKDKADRAISAGAVAVLVFNNEDGLLHGTLGDNVSMNLPILGLSLADGERLLKKLAAGESVALSASVDKTDYASFQGTSMATPHVVGVVALIRATNSTLTAAEVRTLIKATATPPSASNTENHYGAGMINAEKAVQQAVLGPIVNQELLLTGTN